MGEVAKAIAPDAVLDLGDTHHYQGVQSVTDPLWMTNFELIYSHPELQVEWCPVCGNHEYRSNTQDVLDYSAGSLSRPAPDGEQGMQFTSADAGFSILDVDKEALSLSMIDGKGRIIHRIRLTH